MKEQLSPQAKKILENKNDKLYEITDSILEILKNSSLSLEECGICILIICTRISLGMPDDFPDKFYEDLKKARQEMKKLDRYKNTNC